MGGCCSGDSLPDVPAVIKPDPAMAGNITFVTKRLGMWGRDYSVHENVYPDNKEQVKEQMWLWLNKSDGGIIDVENFVRGKNPDLPNKGEVLYSATVTERPYFEQFQRPAQTGLMGLASRFMGFFGGTQSNDYNPNASSGYDSDDDFYYINNPEHTRKFDSQGRRHQSQAHHNMITKWRLNTKAVIQGGNTGRAAAQLNGQPIILEVFSKGTCATGWEDIERTSTDENGDIRTYWDTEKHETEWVDRIEFRLSCGGQFWASWYVIGDTHYNPGTDVGFQSPLGITTAIGGWFSASKYVHQTNVGCDPALTLLIHHLMTTEYSIQELKNDLHPNTPDRPPSMFNYIGPQNTQFGGIELGGQFTFN